MRGAGSPLPARPGYVFILTLGAIAALTLILAGAHLMQRLNSEAGARLRQQAELERDLRSAQAHALHLLLTAPFGQEAVHAGGVLDADPLEGGLIEPGDPVSARGLPRRIEINGRTLLIRLISVQGLIGFDPEEEGMLRHALEQAGFDTDEAARLAARLADYADEDTLLRFGGAEQPDYPEGRSPANAPLRSAREACSVPGWEETPLCRQDPRLLDLYFNPAPGAASQPQFLPDHVLDFILPEPEARERAGVLYAAGAVRRFSDLGLPDWDARMEGEFGYPPLGSEFLILTHAPEASLVLVRRVHLMPGDVRRPFEVGFEFLIGGAQVEQSFSWDLAETLEAFPVSEPPSGEARGN